MKNIATILLLFLSVKCSSQYYTASWTSYNHNNYEVQQSIDNLNWLTINTIVGSNIDSNYSSYVPGATYYYRIKAGDVVSNSILVYSVLPVTLSYFYLQSNPTNVTIVFKSENETGGYYKISKSYDGVNYNEVYRVKEKGNSVYQIMINK